MKLIVKISAQPMPAAMRALLNDAATLSDRLAGKLPMKPAFAAVLVLTLATLVQAGQTCPVEVKKFIDAPYGSVNKVSIASELAGVGGKSRGHFGLDYANRSDKDVLTVRFGVAYLNSMRELKYTDFVTTKEHKLKPGKSTTVVGPNGYITGGEKAHAVWWVEKVMFSDGTYWNDDGSRSCGNYNIPEQTASDTPLTKSSTGNEVPKVAQRMAPTELRRLLVSGAVMTPVMTVPAGAALLVGDSEFARAPATLLVRPGEKFTITIKQQGYKTITQEVTSGGPYIIRLESETVAGDPPATR